MSGTGYLIAAYLAAGALYAGYLAMLWRRERAPRRREARVAELGLATLLIALAAAGWALLSGFAGAFRDASGPRATPSSR